MIPIVGAVNGGKPVEYAMPIRESIMRPGTIAFEVRGDSMEPTFSKRDILPFVRDGESESKWIAAVHAADDGPIIKQRRRAGSAWILVSDNSAHPPGELKDGERIFGAAKVVVQRVLIKKLLSLLALGLLFLTSSANAEAKVVAHAGNFKIVKEGFWKNKVLTYVYALTGYKNGFTNGAPLALRCDGNKPLMLIKINITGVPDPNSWVPMKYHIGKLKLEKGCWMIAAKAAKLKLAYLKRRNTVYGKRPASLVATAFLGDKPIGKAKPTLYEVKSAIHVTASGGYETSIKFAFKEHDKRFDNLVL